MGFLLELLTSFSLGILANLNPCVLPLYPGFLSYISSRPEIQDQQRFAKLAGLLVLSGVMIFMIIIGAITAAFGLSINAFVSYASPIAFTILIVIGILLLLNIDLKALLPQWRTPIKQNPYISALLFGLMYGPIVIPCNAPLVFAVFAYSVGVGGFLSKFALFIAFGLGLGLPLLALSIISTAKGSWLIQKFVKYHTTVNRIAGALLIILGLYELIFVFRIFG